MYELIQAKGSSYYIESPAKVGLVRLNDTEVCLIDSGSDKDAGRKARQLMEKNGLIRRESVAQDARLKRIVLTQKARDLHRQIEADILAFESNLARGISEEEQEVFLRVAKKMQENLREDLVKQGISICKGGDCE